MPNCIKVPCFPALYYKMCYTKTKSTETELPAPMTPRSEISFWSFLKQCIGMELSKITMPVSFNEPLSLIQRFSEYMVYANLIETAALSDDPIERMEYVAAFAVSALSSNWGRIGKPFNPLLGETFELNRPDLGFHYVGEQVSHHPPVTAFHAEGNFYTFFGSIQPKLRFWGKSVEIIPKGVVTLILNRYKETYTWQNVNFVVHNVVVGNIWVEHVGQMEIHCNKSNITTTLTFKPFSWFGKDLHRVDGFIFSGKVKERALYGNWILGLYSCIPEQHETYMRISYPKSRFNDPQEFDVSKMKLMTYNYDIPGQKTLWKAIPPPSNSATYFQFSHFSMSLNQLLPKMKDMLPPTDSRLRPDIRHLEEGQLDLSALEKNRMEEKQRFTREEKKREKTEHHPRWFSLQRIPSTLKEDWVFDTDYWRRDWSKCLNIF